MLNSTIPLKKLLIPFKDTILLLSACTKLDISHQISLPIQESLQHIAHIAFYWVCVWHLSGENVGVTISPSRKDPYPCPHRQRKFPPSRGGGGKMC